MKVLVPSATTLDTRYGKSMQASGLAKPPAKPQSGLRVDAQGRPLYVVGAGDTLGEISRRYLGKTSRSDEISRLNQEQLPNPNKLKEGMILLLPERRRRSSVGQFHPRTPIRDERRALGPPILASGGRKPPDGLPRREATCPPLSAADRCRGVPHGGRDTITRPAPRTSSGSAPPSPFSSPSR